MQRRAERLFAHLALVEDRLHLGVLALEIQERDAAAAALGAQPARDLVAARALGVALLAGLEPGLQLRAQGSQVGVGIVAVRPRLAAQREDLLHLLR
ncbi:MAG TPA: hypothetical protein VHI93_02940, partial [Candidatus Thermoplasmatota archaeon]|nr:hypothetical protein [Candidatus Thermoplasmatota archaeon]